MFVFLLHPIRLLQVLRLNGTPTSGRFSRACLLNGRGRGGRTRSTSASPAVRPRCSLSCCVLSAFCKSYGWTERRHRV